MRRRDTEDLAMGRYPAMRFDGPHDAKAADLPPGFLWVLYEQGEPLSLLPMREPGEYLLRFIDATEEETATWPLLVLLVPEGEARLMEGATVEFADVQPIGRGGH